MRFAVPVSNGVLSQHFGHCEKFAFIDVDEEKKEIINKEMVQSPGHQPGALPGWLAQEGVSVVLAGGMGSRAQNMLNQNRIKVIVNILESDPDQAVLKYLEGNLETGAEFCDH